MQIPAGVNLVSDKLADKKLNVPLARFRDPNFQNPRLRDPNFQNPRLRDPNFPNPRLRDPNFQNPRLQDRHVSGKSEIPRPFF